MKAIALVLCLLSAQAFAGHDICYVNEEDGVPETITVTTDYHGDVKTFEYEYSQNWNVTRQHCLATRAKALQLANSLRASGVCSAVVDRTTCTGWKQ